MAKDTSVETLDAKTLADAIKSREDGRPMPAGVTWNPGRNPQYLSASEQAHFDATGEIPASARKRAESEFEKIPSFDAFGNQLTAEQIREGRNVAATTGGVVEASNVTSTAPKS